jgi:hypothetical protein
MNEAPFEEYLERCVEALQEKNGLLETVHGLGSYDRWHYDGPAATLTFWNEEEETQLVAEITEIGTYSLNTQTWMWAWANESATPAARQQAEALQSLFDTTGNSMFRDAHFDCDEFLAWELASAAVEHLEALGCYRAPSGHLWMFVAIDRLSTATREPAT